MFEKTEGTAQKLAGRVQGAFGSVTNDAATQLEGKAREVTGQIQEGYGEALNQVRQVTVTNPLGTLAIVAGIGFFLGAIWAKR